jgi:hypothetical protein
MENAQVMQVLTSAAQRVAHEAHSQVIASLSASEPPGPELQVLVKQQHVLTLTAQAFDKEVTSHNQQVGSPQSLSSALARAAHQVVMQAARSVRADRLAVVGSASLQSIASQQVTVNEVSVATQTAVAQAVELTGPLSSEVDVLRTATSLLQQQQSRASMDSSMLIGSNSFTALTIPPPLGFPEYALLP